MLLPFQVRSFRQEPLQESDAPGFEETNEAVTVQVREQIFFTFRIDKGFRRICDIFSLSLSLSLFHPLLLFLFLLGCTGI